MVTILGGNNGVCQTVIDFYRHLALTDPTPVILTTDLHLLLVLYGPYQLCEW